MLLSEALLRPGDHFLTFRVTRLLARGGAAEVYEIEHQGKRFALKVIPGLSLSRAMLARHEQEWRVLEWMVGNANVVAVHDWGTTREGIGWIRMELLHGCTIRERLTRGGPLSVQRTCLYLRQIACALDAAHRKGAVHRDVKPENVFVLDDEITIKILDYGIAKVYGGIETIDGRRRGTPPYMAPEQFRSTTVTPATDVWALGVMAYEMLTGEHPFMGEVTNYDVDDLSNRVLLDPPKPLVDVPQPIAELVMKALQKKPEARYRDGRAFEMAIVEAWQRLEQECATDEEEHEEAVPRVLALPARGAVYRADTLPLPDRRGERRADTMEDAIPPSRSKIRPTDKAHRIAQNDTLELPTAAGDGTHRASIPFVPSVPLRLPIAELPTLPSATRGEAAADADTDTDTDTDADTDTDTDTDTDADTDADTDVRSTLSPPNPAYRTSAGMLLVMMAAQATSMLIGLGAGYLIWGRTLSTHRSDPPIAAAEAYVSATVPAPASVSAIAPAAASAPVSRATPTATAASFPVLPSNPAEAEPVDPKPSMQRSSTARPAPLVSLPPAKPPPVRRRRLIE
ncbi:MAG: serine/threonine protein kinase [Polyangiaceae bacterium]|nr:protein kinase [Polyangiaceae bacterium]NUQ75042.1 serine/threonine protein kinase [Polyangiaceae bacterium]